METAPLPGDSARLESAVAKQRRLAPEAELLAEAFADVAAGRIVDEAEVDAWIDSLGTDHELPLPRSNPELAARCRGGCSLPTRRWAIST